MDNWLDVLVDVVVDVLTSNCGTGCLSVLSISYCTGVFELSGLVGESLLDMVIIAVLDVAVLNSNHVVAMLLWENLAILHRLDGSVVVILVDLTVDGGLLLIVLSTSDVLICDGWVDGLVYGGIVLSIAVEKSRNGLLSFVHFD